MIKNIENNIDLKNHQLLPIKFIKNNFGLILYHTTGSGKTITSLVSMYQFNKRILIIGPKSSKKAFNDEINKLNYDKSRFEIYSFKKIKILMYESDETLFKNKCVIIDEAHHLRSDTKENIVLSGMLLYAHKVMLLTATPIVNYLNDLAPLVNIVKRSDVLPTDRELFNFFYFDEDKLEMNNEHMLMDRIKNSISYYENKNDINFPKSKVYPRTVVMDGKQLEEYGKFVKRYIYNYQVPTSADIFNIKFDVLKRGKLNSFLGATRQISNTIDGDIDSPKLKHILKVLVRERFPAVIYSNYLKNGVYAVAKLLEKNNTSYKLITGNTTSDKINSIVNDYNSRKFNVLILSTAGSESLDLKNTRQIHIMEPHWNDAKIQQVIGRVIRYKSHNDLPIDERFVKIFRWLSVFPRGYSNISADEYLLEISEKKMKIHDSFKNIIRKASIEENINNKIGGYFAEYIKYKNEYLRLKKLI